jgi:hypothetical protein
MDSRLRGNDIHSVIVGLGPTIQTILGKNYPSFFPVNLS